MKHSDIAALMKGAAPVIRNLIAAAVKPLEEKVAELERSLAAAHAAAIVSAVADAVGALPPAKPGKDADPEAIRQLVEDAVAAIPPATPGKDADPELIRSMVAEEVGKLEPAEPGKDADLAVVAEMVRSEVERAVAAIPPAQDGHSPSPEELGRLIDDRLPAAISDAVRGIPVPKDGVGLAGALIDRSGGLVLTLTDGTAKDLGRVVGTDADERAIGAHIKDLVDAIPKPQDGVGFDDLDVVETDEGFALRFVRGEVVREFPLPIVIDRGVFKEGRAYRKGNGVTWGGSFWIAQKDTPEGKPDSPDSGWRLAVKRGQNAKAA